MKWNFQMKINMRRETSFYSKVIFWRDGLPCKVRQGTELTVDT